MSSLDLFSEVPSRNTPPGVGVSRAPSSGLAHYVANRLALGFYINLPLGGAAALFIGLIAIPDQIPKGPVSLALLKSLLPRFDLAGFALFAPASVMLLLALQFGAGEYGWDSSEVIGLFVGAGVTALIFLAWEWKMGDEAMLPFSMICQRVVWTSALNFSLLVLTAVVGSNFMPIYLQSVRGLSPTMSGVYMLAQILPGIMFILISGALGKLHPHC